MRRADIVRMIRPLQLSLVLVPLVALVLYGSLTHAETRTPGHTPSSLDNATGSRCAR
jgi:hypothetical protein